MNKIIRLRFRHQLAQEWNRSSAASKLRIALWSFAAGLLMLGVLFLTGCQSPGGQAMSHAAFTAAVTLGEQFALEQHPEAVPYVRAAVPVVCSVANGTNVSPQAIVSALEAANVTNATTKLIVNSSLALFNVVISGISTNQTEVKLYAQDLCNGMTAGLPPGEPIGGKDRAMAKKALKSVPSNVPHLR